MFDDEVVPPVEVGMVLTVPALSIPIPSLATPITPPALFKPTPPLFTNEDNPLHPTRAIMKSKTNLFIFYFSPLTINQETGSTKSVPGK
jgi:hypothetical protein